MDNLTFKTSATGDDRLLMAYSNNGTQVGYISYAVEDGDVFVKMVEVVPQYRRQGVGKALAIKLQAMFPESQINWGSTTGDGAQLINSLPTHSVPSKYRADFNQLDSLKSEADILLNKFKNNSATDDDSDRLEDIRDEITELEDYLYGKPKSLTLIGESQMVNQMASLIYRIEKFLQN